MRTLSIYKKTGLYVMCQIFIVSILCSVIIAQPEHWLNETRSSCKIRITKDITSIKSLVSSSSLSSSAKATANTELGTLQSQANSSSFPAALDGFKAIIPYNDIHKNAFKVYSRVLASTSKTLKVWHSMRYTGLGLFAKPGADISSLKIKMMHNEYRSAAFNITNCTEDGTPVNISISNLPAGCLLKVYQLEFVDTKMKVPAASALVELTGKLYKANVPSGMTKQIWLTVNSGNMVPGDYNVSVKVNRGSFTKNITLSISVVNRSFPNKPEYNSIMWDYTVNRSYGITSKNQAAAAKDLIQHYVSAPVVIASSAPRPQPRDYNADGSMKPGFNYSKFSKVINMFPNARYYAVFFNYFSKNNFAGFTFGSPSWARAIGTWAKGFAAYMTSIGKKPGQLMLYWTDEPGSESVLQTAALYTKAVEDYAPEVTTFCTINARAGVSSSWGAKVIQYTDILCPARYGKHYKSLSESQKNIFRNLPSKGKQFWMYACNYKYTNTPEQYLVKYWYDFKQNCNGTGWWAYADMGMNPSNWNMYPTYKRDNYSPLYIDKNSITTSREWEACREGIENNEYLIMLRKRINELTAKGQSSADITKGKQLLQALPTTAKAAESTRQEVLSCIVKLGAGGNVSIDAVNRNTSVYNPFAGFSTYYNSSTKRITAHLPSGLSSCELTLYDPFGRSIKRLFSGKSGKTKDLTLAIQQEKPIAAGRYFIQLTSPEKKAVSNIVLW